MKYLLCILVFSSFICAYGQSTAPVWTDLRDFGCVGNGIADDTACLAGALANASATNGLLWCPTGIYRITTVAIPSSITISGPGRSDSGFKGRCEIRGSTSAAMLTLSGAFYVTIEQLVINGANISTAGIFDAGSVGLKIHDNYFVGFSTGNAAIRGGGTLYTDIKDNVFSMAGYAMDFQNGYSRTPSQTYFGINVGTISGNIVSASNGVRVGGTINIENNDLETPLDSPAIAVLNVCEPGFNAFARVVGNYFEIRKGTAPILEGIATCDAVEIEVESNRMFADTSVGSIAVDAASHGYVYTLLAQYNFIAYFDKGFDALPASAPLGGNSSNFEGNTFALTPTPYVLANVANTVQAGQNALVRSAIPTKGFIFSGGAIVGTVSTNADLTSIDLSVANQFQLYGNAPHTLGAVTNSVPGQFFILQFKSNFTTVSNAVFHLCVNKNRTFLAESTAQFFVDADNKVRQVCE